MGVITMNLPPSEATSKQLLMAVYKSNQKMEKLMADLTQAVTDLQAAVTAVADRLLPQVTALQEALATAQAADVADLATAQTAADAIEASVVDLGAIGTPAA